MCRYSFRQYPDHYACFGCRKAFKLRRWEFRRVGKRWVSALRPRAPAEPVCPDCGHPMTNMGWDFKAPPKSDRKAWEIVGAVIAHGFNFFGYGCGCRSGFKPPKRRREFPAWLETHRRLGKGESLAKSFAARRLGPS